MANRIFVLAQEINQYKATAASFSRAKTYSYAATASVVPNGQVTSPFFRNETEQFQLTGRREGRRDHQHLGIDITVSSAPPHRGIAPAGGGANDPRRGLPVYCTLKSRIPISDLNAISAFNKTTGEMLSGLGISGSGEATLVNIRITSTPNLGWNPSASGAYGGAVGMACRYSYNNNGTAANFTIYLEFLHLITSQYLPKNGEGALISLQEWQATGKGIDFGPRIIHGSVITAAEFASFSPMLIGYLGATESPHVHIQAAFGTGIREYMNVIRLDPSLLFT